MIVHIINLKKRTDRRDTVIQQMNEQGASYMFWDGVEGRVAKENISKAHKKIIRYAKDSKMPMVLISEDDVKFTHKNSLKYFIENIPNEFDLFLSGYYSGSADDNFIIKKFSGMTMYVCAERYYDTFLSVPENFHLDTALGMAGGKFVVCPKFICTQVPGYSDQRKRYADDSKRLRGKIMYNG